MPRIAPGVERESRQRLWILLALYPVFVAAMVTLALGVYVDADDAAPGEWAEPVAVRVPLAAVCIAVATAAALKRIRALRFR